MKQIPTPPIPKNPRISYFDLAEFHSRLFVGRNELFMEINKFIRERPTPYVFLKALAGMGKTAFIAKLYELHASKNEKKIPRPSYWSGWCLRPSSIEFWLHKNNRIHERLRYNKTSSGWKKEILYP